MSTTHDEIKRALELVDAIEKLHAWSMADRGNRDWKIHNICADGSYDISHSTWIGVEPQEYWNSNASNPIDAIIALAAEVSK